MTNLCVNLIKLCFYLYSLEIFILLYFDFDRCLVYCEQNKLLDKKNTHMLKKFSLFAFPGVKLKAVRFDMSKLQEVFVKIFQNLISIYI